jgi:hypothetical protein
MYVALTVFLDNECTQFDRVCHLEDGDFWLKSAAEFIGRPVKEGDCILGVRVDRIGSESPDDDFNYVGSRHHY